MRPLHYLEIRNFKQFGDVQRIELNHPTVLIGPNNCGKTTAIQAMALWSQAVKTWFERKGEAPPKQRTKTSLNRLNIVSVPVPLTRHFWHNTVVRKGHRHIHIEITLGVLHGGRVEPVTMRLRNEGTELVYCGPDESTLDNLDTIRTAAGLDVRLLYPMSGIDIEEPLLQPGRVEVLLGQGQTAQVLRNLCLMVYRDDPGKWRRIADLMNRLFTVELGKPTETMRGTVALEYRQSGVRNPLEVALAGRGLQQMLLVLAYIHSHRHSVLLVDEPDAHLEILRQKQVYTLLRQIAVENDSQVVIATHSEVVHAEALDDSLTLLLDGAVSDLAAREDILDTLRYYGAEHYVRALRRGHVLYVEGKTDFDILQALAKKLGHPVADVWESHGGINVYYTQDNFPVRDVESELSRVEGGFGDPRDHFSIMGGMLPGLRGLWIRDSDGRSRADSAENGLSITFWRRYEIENYVVHPGIIRRFAEENIVAWQRAHPSDQGFDREDLRASIDRVLDEVVLKHVFDDDARALSTWKKMDPEDAQLVWLGHANSLKLSHVAEEFFRLLGETLGIPMLLRKRDLYQLVRLIEPVDIPPEVSIKLDLLMDLVRPGPGPGA